MTLVRKIFPAISMVVISTFMVSTVILSTSSISFAQENASTLDMSLKPKEVIGEDRILNVYKDMIVVQNRAKEKADHWLFNPYFNFDFSDGPTTMYTLTLNFGRAFGESWEVYLSAAPSILANEREIFKQINNKELSDGSVLKITYAKPKSYYGLEVLWAPVYGKDSLGPRSIVRSDMFLKLGGGVVQFEQDSGARVYMMAGKTFFITKHFHLRVAAGAGFVQTPIDNLKKNQNVGLLEFGNVWYF